MSDSFEVLGQAVGTGTEFVLYTVPSEAQIIVSSIQVSETAGGTPTYSVSIAKAALAAADKQYLVKAKALTARQLVVLAEGITLDETDVIRVDGSTAAVSFQLFGVKITKEA
mgnify:CR=1 FL=1|jgi:hypothetical protein